MKYKDLTPQQQANIGNGCGGGKTALFVPNFTFYADCNQHDFYYWRGGNIFDKSKADWLFYYYMVKDLKMEDNYFLKVFYFLMATIYYIMVSVFGSLFFNWGKQKVMSDLTK